MSNVPLSDLRVLIVEDNSDMQFLLKCMVREFGVQSIETAEDGTGALSVMQSVPVDMVVCDIQMQPMDGIEFVKTVRGGHLGIEPLVPIILLTAHSRMERVAEAGIVGVDGFVTKPVSAHKLHVRMKSVAAKPRSSLVATRRGTVARIGDSDVVDAEIADRARAVVANLADAYIESATRDIETLDDAYAHAVAEPAERGAEIERIARLAHDIEGQGGSFGYPLMTAIGESLGDCCRATERREETRLELIKSHVDAMKAVIGNRLEGDGNGLGAELVGLLRDAVAKSEP